MTPRPAQLLRFLDSGFSVHFRPGNGGLKFSGRYNRLKTDAFLPSVPVLSAVTDGRSRARATIELANCSPVRLLPVDGPEVPLGDYRKSEREHVKAAIGRAIRKYTLGESLPEGGYVIVVAGPSGAGKSFVLDEIDYWNLGFEIFKSLSPEQQSTAVHRPPDYKEETDAAKYRTLLRPGSGPHTIICLNVTESSPIELRYRLKKLGVTPSEVIFLYPKPLSQRQQEEAQATGISLYHDVSPDHDRVFFRQPYSSDPWWIDPRLLPPSEHVTTSSDQDALLHMVACLTIRHAEMFFDREIDYPRDQDAYFKACTQWMRDFAKCSGMSEDVLVNILQKRVLINDVPPLRFGTNTDPITALSWLKLFVLAYCASGCRSDVGCVDVSDIVSCLAKNAAGWAFRSGFYSDEGLLADTEAVTRLTQTQANRIQAQELSARQQSALEYILTVPLPINQVR